MVPRKFRTCCNTELAVWSPWVLSVSCIPLPECPAHHWLICQVCFQSFFWPTSKKKEKVVMVSPPLRKMFPLAFWAGKSIAIGKHSHVVLQVFWLARGLNPENTRVGPCRKQIRHVCPQCISLLTLERKQARNWCWTHPGWSPVRGLECMIAKIIYCSALWCKEKKSHIQILLKALESFIPRL